MHTKTSSFVFSWFYEKKLPIFEPFITAKFSKLPENGQFISLTHKRGLLLELDRNKQVQRRSRSSRRVQEQKEAPSPVVARRRSLNHPGRRQGRSRKWRCYYTCCVFYVSLPTRYSLCSGSFVLSLWLPCGILDMRCAFINQSCCSFRQDSDSGVSKTCASKIFRRQMDFVASDLKSLYPKHSIYGIFMYQPQNFYLCQKFGLTITRDIDYKTWIWLHQSTYRKISILNI